jgi:hybrid cluster-associated redox disulfide protein
MVQITKDTIIGDILDVAPETAPAFLAIGMHCLGCPSSRGETVEQACMVHGVEVEELLESLNALIPARK